MSVKRTKVTIERDVNDFETLVYMLQESARSVSGLFDSSLDGVLSEHKDLTQAENALMWMKDNYRIAASALRMIAHTSDELADALLHESIEIVPKKQDA